MKSDAEVKIVAVARQTHHSRPIMEVKYEEEMGSGGGF